MLNESDLRIVVSLANHFRQLRQRAESMQQSFESRQRGYFTPDEDDQIVHLWMSYHKSRTALKELIDSVRDRVGKASADHAGEFAVAYAAALVLVDAARTLRDSFAGNDRVRRKLNESFQAYGIPEGSFDAIQMSLTDPRNALAIREANEFYDQHRDLLHGLSQEDTGLVEILTLIDRLRGSVSVSVARYVRARAVDRGRDARDRILWGTASRLIYAIQEWGSRLVSDLSTKPGHVARLPDGIVAAINDLLQPGDVFITRKDAALTNYFLPGFWPHAAMYVGDQHVIESLKDGVHRRAMDSPYGNDAVTVIRPTVQQDAIADAVARAHRHVGKPYDFDFDFTRSDRLVCTEVVYRSYQGVAGIHFQLTRRAGRQTLSAEDLLALALKGDAFQPVAAYCQQHSDRLVVGQEVATVLNATMNHSD